MRVLQINCVYQKGSTGKIVYDLHTGYQKSGMESYVLIGRGVGKNVKQDAHVEKVCSEGYAKANNLLSRFSGIMYGGCYFSTKKIEKRIRQINPDIVHLHCINGYFVNIYALLEWLHDNRIPTVLTVHAEFMYTGGCGYAFECSKWMEVPGCQRCERYREETNSVFFNRTGDMWNRMYHAFQNFSNLEVVSVSPWLMKRAQSSPVMRELHHQVILNGLDLEVFKPLPGSVRIEKRQQISHNRIVFHAYPELCDDPKHNKGGFYVLMLAKHMPHVTFLIAGPHSIKGEIPPNVKLLGNIHNQKTLAEYYSLADVTLLTSKRETFSMVCAESLSCATPVVGFMAGAPEEIALADYSIFVEYGNMDELQKAVEAAFEMCTEQLRDRAKETYDEAGMVKGYINLYKRMLNKRGGKL